MRFSSAYVCGATWKSSWPLSVRKSVVPSVASPQPSAPIGKSSVRFSLRSRPYSKSFRSCHVIWITVSPSTSTPSPKIDGELVAVRTLRPVAGSTSRTRDWWYSPSLSKNRPCASNASPA